ncbi:Mandelate racemase/muconate lactonizing enzyme, C-terminal domain protein [Thermosinus carboxydivorans Nor1]|uniref:Dipeptide epimerase n=1 Tax=Thermosinus carboxydivorans Nor1 TaxID=401526 RepID=A1HLW3_9FIRM|nr:dipeptide epimerase [Thermosinus carboxydivorans]EAX48816.1 Mandelate racemase/muconate lactonizing enzyme, C-terminal domain protein [Thermosinus carboxydivorans Nor1]
MKITAIKVGKVRIPLKKPFKTALRTVYAAEDIVVKVITDEGVIGFGSAAPTAVITGDTQGAIVAAIWDCIAPKIIGMEADRLEELMAALDGAAVHNTSAKAAVDIALYDLFGKIHGLPVYKLFGGYRREVTTDLTISVNSPEEMVQDALEAVAAGYSELKIKVGTDAELDIRRVKAVRQAVGPAVKIRLDANQGWKPKEAVRTIRRMEDLGLAIELVEQPVAAQDLEGLKFVTDHVETDILADEAVSGPADAFRILAMRAADLINIKLMKAGGLHNALKICHLAETMGVECMMGCMLESKIGITAAASFAAAKKNITRADLDAAVLLAEDPVLGGVAFDQNRILLPEAPGFGVEDVKGWQEI